MKQTISNTVKGIKINIQSSKVVESPFHTSTFSRVYKCRKYNLKLMYNGNSYNFTFHDSVNAYQHNTPLNKKDVLYCVLSDMGCYESSRDMDDFIYSFGYDEQDLKTYKQGMKAYKACKKTSERLHEIFTNDELEKLQEEFQDY